MRLDLWALLSQSLPPWQLNMMFGQASPVAHLDIRGSGSGTHMDNVKRRCESEGVVVRISYLNSSITAARNDRKLLWRSMSSSGLRAKFPNT